MKFKKVLVLILVAAVLVVANLLKKLESEKSRVVQDRLALAAEPLLTKETSVAFVDRLVIRKGPADDDAIVLAKHDGGDWIMENRFGLRADKGQVENLIRSLTEAKGEVRVNSGGVLGDFSLEENQALAFALSSKGGGEIARIFVSPTRAGPGENFARLADSDRVLAIGTDILSMMGIYAKGDKLNYKIFADFRMLSVDAAKVTRIQIASKVGAPLTLVKKEGADPVLWSLDPDQGSAVDAAKVNDFLSGVITLFASEIMDPEGANYGFDAGRPWITLTETKDGKSAEYGLLLGSRSDEAHAYFMKSSPESHVFKVGEVRVDALLKRDKASFLKPTA